MSTIEQTKTFRAGDVVKHLPTGEEWILASVSPTGMDVSPAGWPESLAPASDCELVEAATDEQHRTFLLQVLAGNKGGSNREAWAFRNLLALHSDEVLDEYRRLSDESNEAYKRYQAALADQIRYEALIRAGELLPTIE